MAPASKANGSNLGPKPKRLPTSWGWQKLLKDRQLKEQTLFEASASAPSSPPKDSPDAAAARQQLATFTREHLVSGDWEAPQSSNESNASRELLIAAKNKGGSRLTRALTHGSLDKELVGAIDDQVVDAICKRFDDECETVREMVLTEITVLMDTMVSAEVRLTLSELANLRKNFHCVERATRLQKKDWTGASVTPEPSQEESVDFEGRGPSNPLKRQMQVIVQNRQREGKPGTLIVPFEPYQQLISQDTMQKFNALMRLAKVFARDLKAAVKGMKFPDRAQTQSERDRLVAMQEEEMKLLRAELDVAVMNAELKASQRSKEQIESLKHQHAEEVKIFHTKWEKLEQQAEKKARRRVEARMQDLEEKLSVANRRLDEGDYELKKRMRELESEAAKWKESSIAVGEANDELKEEGRKLARDLRLARDEISDARRDVEIAFQKSRAAESDQARYEQLYRKEQKLRTVGTEHQSALEAKLEKMTEEFHACEALSQSQARELQASREKLADYLRLQEDFANLKKALTEERRHKEKVIRRNWSLENALEKLLSEQSEKDKELDDLRQRVKKQSADLGVCDLALQGMDRQVHKKVDAIQKEVHLAEVLGFLKSRCNEIKCGTSRNLLQCKIQVGQAGMSASEAERDRRAVRVGVLELEIEVITEQLKRVHEQNMKTLPASPRTEAFKFLAGSSSQHDQTTESHVLYHQQAESAGPLHRSHIRELPRSRSMPGHADDDNTQLHFRHNMTSSDRVRRPLAEIIHDTAPLSPRLEPDPNNGGAVDLESKHTEDVESPKSSTFAWVGFQGKALQKMPRLSRRRPWSASSKICVSRKGAGDSGSSSAVHVVTIGQDAMSSSTRGRDINTANTQ